MGVADTVQRDWECEFVKGSGCMGDPGLPQIPSNFIATLLEPESIISTPLGIINPFWFS